MLWLTFLLVWELAGNMIYWAVQLVHVVPNSSSSYNGFIFFVIVRSKGSGREKKKCQNAAFIKPKFTWTFHNFSLAGLHKICAAVQQSNLISSHGLSMNTVWILLLQQSVHTLMQFTSRGPVHQQSNSLIGQQLVENSSYMWLLF